MHQSVKLVFISKIGNVQSYIYLRKVKKLLLLNVFVLKFLCSVTYPSSDASFDSIPYHTIIGCMREEENFEIFKEYLKL